MINYKYVMLYSDQPTTCPKCGARTDIILDLSHTNCQAQVNQCLSNECNFEFVAQDDERAE